MLFLCLFCDCLENPPQALAQIGRGFCEIVWKGSDVLRQMVYLLGMTNAPVLTELKVGIAKTAENVEIFPYPIPDLFCGSPLLISGKYTGVFPDKISVLGFLSTGEKFQVDVPVESNSQIPVDKIFVKQELDILTANVSPFVIILFFLSFFSFSDFLSLFLKRPG